MTCMDWISKFHLALKWLVSSNSGPRCSLFHFDFKKKINWGKQPICLQGLVPNVEGLMMRLVLFRNVIFVQISVHLSCCEEKFLFSNQYMSSGLGQHNKVCHLTIPWLLSPVMRLECRSQLTIGWCRKSVLASYLISAITSPRRGCMAQISQQHSINVYYSSKTFDHFVIQNTDHWKYRT